MNVRKTTLVWQSSIKKKKLFDKLWQPPHPSPPRYIESTAILGDLGAHQNVFTLKILRSFIHTLIL